MNNKNKNKNKIKNKSDKLKSLTKTDLKIIYKLNIKNTMFNIYKSMIENHSPLSIHVHIHNMNRFSKITSSIYNIKINLSNISINIPCNIINNEINTDQPTVSMQVYIDINNPWSFASFMIHPHSNQWILYNIYNLIVNCMPNPIVNLYHIFINDYDYAYRQLTIFCILNLNLIIKLLINMSTNPKIIIYTYISWIKLLSIVILNMIININVHISMNIRLIKINKNIYPCFLFKLVFYIIYANDPFYIIIWELPFYVIHIIYTEYNPIVYYTKLSYKDCIILSKINWWWLKSSI